MVAGAVAGGTLAAAGSASLAHALPAAIDGAGALQLGIEELLGRVPAPERVVPVAYVEPLVAPVTPEPVVVDAADLVKAVDLETRAAEAARAEAARAETARAEAADAEAARAEAARTEAAGAEADRIEVTARAEEAAASGGLQMMVGRVSSGFGARWGSRHQGLDIAAPIGTTIRVPLDGTVIDSGSASGFGMWVRVRHGDGTITVYGHINRSMVSAGEAVSASQVIAEVGNRGRSTGPHLHFEVITSGGKKINPRPWLDERGIGYT